jgi:hypothetical protein
MAKKVVKKAKKGKVANVRKVAKKKAAAAKAGIAATRKKFKPQDRPKAPKETK